MRFKDIWLIPILSERKSLSNIVIFGTLQAFLQTLLEKTNTIELSQ